VLVPKSRSNDVRMTIASFGAPETNIGNPVRRATNAP
jgi:hypothetical protein